MSPSPPGKDITYASYPDAPPPPTLRYTGVSPPGLCRTGGGPGPFTRIHEGGSPRGQEWRLVVSTHPSGRGGTDILGSGVRGRRWSGGGGRDGEELGRRAGGVRGTFPGCGPERACGAWGRVGRGQPSCALSTPPLLSSIPEVGNQESTTGVSRPPSQFLSCDRAPSAALVPPGAAASHPGLGRLPPVPMVPAAGQRVRVLAGPPRLRGRWPSASPRLGAGGSVPDPGMRGRGAVSLLHLLHREVPGSSTHPPPQPPPPPPPHPTSPPIREM